MEPQKTSLSVSKITPPRLPRIVYRSRLLKLIEQNKDKKLLLILGQAAQGKSTLAASYVHNLEIPSAWINLSEEDSDPVNLFYSMVLSLQHVLNDVDLSPVLSYPSVSMGPRLEIPLYREWINAIFERISVPIQIVLDGLDRLSSEALSFQFIQVLVEDVPNHIHLMMLSRKEPPFEVQALKMRQEAGILTNEDLAFTQDEIKAFFRELRGMSFASNVLRKVHQLTEGWIGGLILLSETLDRLPEDLRERYLSEDIHDRFKGAVFQYFGEEILSSQPASIQEFLIKSSILDIVEPGFVKDFIGIEGASDVLHEHVRKNLFLQSTYDEKKGWVFQYHQLFRDFLRAKFRSEIGEKERRSLFIKAGSLYEEKGELEESVKYYLEAKAYDRAMSVIEQIGMNFVQMGRAGDLAQWLQAIPEDLVQENPWLLFYLSMTTRFATAEKNVQNLQKAFSLFSEQEDLRGQLLSLAFLIEASIFRGHDLIPLRFLLEQADMLLQSSSTERYSYERAILLCQMGFGQTVRGGNPRKGFWACQNAYLISKELGDFPLQVNALVNTVQALCWLGEFALADEKLKVLKSLAEKNSSVGVRLLHHTAHCELSLCRGEFELAGKLIESAKNEAEQHGLTYLYPVTLLDDLMLKPHLEQYREAEEIGNRLLSFSAAIGNSFFTGLAHLFLGRSLYFEGEYRKAGTSVKHSRDLLSSDEARSEYHLGFICVLNGFLSYHLQENGHVEEDLQKALNHFKDLSSFVAADAHFAMALLKQSQAKTKEAIVHLEAGLKFAREKGNDHFTCTSPRDLLEICILVLELEVGGAIDYAAYLLSTRLASLSQPELKRLALHPSSKIREKASEIRRAIHRSRAPHLHIETLGGFRVLRGDSPVAEKEWQGKKPRAILKSIMASNSKGVLNEIIMENIWPDAPFDKVGKNYKVALHRLRKALEPGIDKALGSSYIHIKDDALYLDEDLCEVDTHKFLSLIENGKTKEKEGDIKGALKHYNEAAALYKGDFLPEDLYAPWIELRREELRNAYIALLNRIATLHENKGARSKAISFYTKAIRFSPLLEDAYQRLMVLYSIMGKRNEALKIYERCRKVLRDELDVEPDQVTVALYEKIVG